MNYERIYNELIEHRKMLPKVEGVYYERHHILPRCMGGGDEEENLIYLTAEDHFMAHLLLARVHGGILWNVIQLMKKSAKLGKIKHRRVFAKARKMVAEYRRDSTVYDLIEVKTGKLFKLTQKQLQEEYGVESGNSSALVKGKKMSGGFCTPAFYEKKVPDYWKNTYTFVNIITGEEYDMKLCEFAEFLEVPIGKISKLLYKDINTCLGYTIKGRDINGTPQPWKIIKLVHTKTGEIVEGTRENIMNKYGMSSAELTNLLVGRVKTSRNLAVPGRLNIVVRDSNVYRWEHISSGEIFVGMRSEIRQARGLTKSAVNSLVQGTRNKALGWRLLGKEEDFDSPPSEYFTLHSESLQQASPQVSSPIPQLQLLPVPQLDSSQAVA